jgi:hypothetical protein
MNLQQFARKLRAAADVLDDLLGVDRPTVNETSDTARLIRNSLNPKLSPKTRAYKKGTHWTQKPENRKKLQRMLKKAASIRHTPKPTVKGKKFKPGTHWTQTPAGRKRMALIQRQRHAADTILRAAS